MEVDYENNKRCMYIRFLAFKSRLDMFDDHELSGEHNKKTMMDDVKNKLIDLEKISLEEGVFTIEQTLSDATQVNALDNQTLEAYKAQLTTLEKNSTDPTERRAIDEQQQHLGQILLQRQVQGRPIYGEQRLLGEDEQKEFKLDNQKDVIDAMTSLPEERNGHQQPIVDFIQLKKPSQQFSDKYNLLSSKLNTVLLYQIIHDSTH